MSARTYLESLEKRLSALHAQEQPIEHAAALCTERIEQRKLVHVFGAGHSRMACEEAYPRIGAVVGFHPVVELAVTNFTHVVGGDGLKQALFLERVPGYGRVIFEALDADPDDATIVVSSSGVEPIILDYVDAARERGLAVIAVTSLAYSNVASTERGGVRRLAELADVVIDNGVPVGDALVQLDGLEERVGASASVLNLAVIDAITVATATMLLARGVDPLVFGSPHLVGAARSAERFEHCLSEYRDRVWRRQPVVAETP